MSFLNRHRPSQPLGLLLLAAAFLSSGLLPRHAQANALQDAADWNLIPYPDQGAPTQSRGGASRSGDWNLIPYPDQGAPSQSRGGASRDGEWNLIPYPDQGAPSQSRGGASRDGEWNLIPYPDQGAPSQSHGGASRRAELPQNMATVMPEIGYGLTVASHPTFFFYLPDSQAQAGLFRLKNAEGKVLYEQAIEQPNQAGIVAIALPATLPELAIGDYYQWYVVLQSEGKFRPSSPFIDGWVQRVEPSQPVQQAQVHGDAAGYVQALIEQQVWYDTLTAVYTQRAADPHSPDAQLQWQALLDSVNLGAIAAAPVVVQNPSH